MSATNTPGGSNASVAGTNQFGSFTSRAQQLFLNDISQAQFNGGPLDPVIGNNPDRAYAVYAPSDVATTANIVTPGTRWTLYRLPAFSFLQAKQTQYGVNYNDAKTALAQQNQTFPGVPRQKSLRYYQRRYI